MNHEAIVSRLVAVAQGDSNTLGFVLFGSVAAGTHREDSDIDVFTILQASRPSSGIVDTITDGIKVGTIYFTYDVLAASVETVPYLLHPLANAMLLFDRYETIAPLLARLRRYFTENPAIVDEWNSYYRGLREEKAKYGCEKTTIIDVWNELEKFHSGGRTRRQFFNSFYMTNPVIFSLLKKFL